MEDPNTVQGAEPAAEEMDLSVPDFSLLEDDPQAEANDQAGATEGETSTTQEGEPKPEAAQDQQVEAQEPEGANLSFDELKKEFPELTPAAVREAMLRDKNLQVGYNKKFMELADQRKALEAERQAIQQLQELSKSGCGGR